MMGIRGRNSARGRSGDHSFAQVPSVSIPRSVFDRSHGVKTTFDSGYLIPIMVDEVLPGDTFTCRTSAVVRLSTPFYPVMDNIFVEFFFFFVPNRLLWDKWQRFCGEQPNPGDTIDFEIPQMPEAVAQGSLSDYFGMPLSATAYDHSALWHRAYNLIWREWFRSEDLQDAPVVDTGDGPDDPLDYVLRRRGKRHDYFTSALPFTQKGDAVLLPLGLTAAVIPESALAVPTFQASTGSGNVTSLQIPTAGATASWTPAGAPAANATAGWVDPNLVADLSTATSATINQLREAWQIQRLLEKDARGGTRYTEILRSQFGVTSPDQRLQRPEYLGGGQVPIVIHSVPRTSFVDGSSGANLSAFGTAALSGQVGFNKSFVEHGVIIGLCAVRAELTYQQGLDRMFSRLTRYEYYWPSFAHLGEQPIYNREIFLQDTAADAEVFGYQERYAEYRYKPSRVTAAMRSNIGSSLDVWHLALDFASLPLLNDTFIEDQPPMARVLTTGSTADEFIADFWFQYRCARPMPVFSVPGLVDHF